MTCEIRSTPVEPGDGRCEQLHGAGVVAGRDAALRSVRR